MAALARRLLQYFTLSNASADAGRLPGHARSAMRQSIALGRQRGEAAETLWSNGHGAEGLRIAREALDATLEAADHLTAAEVQRRSASVADAPIEDDAPTAVVEAGPEDRNKLLLSRGVAERWLERVKSAQVQAQKLPTLDGEVSPAHADLYEELAKGRRVLDKALGLAALEPKEIGRLRIGRTLVAGLVVLLGIGGTVVLTRTPERVTVTASGHFGSSPDFKPEHAFDGDEGTEWLLPNSAAGWVEARISPPRNIRSLRLLNGHNRHFNDRAIQRYRIEVFGVGEPEVVEGEFESLEANPEWVEHEVSVEGVQRIRLTTLSHHESGAALAELAWEEQ